MRSPKTEQRFLTTPADRLQEQADRWASARSVRNDMRLVARLMMRC